MDLSYTSYRVHSILEHHKFVTIREMVSGWNLCLVQRDLGLSVKDEAVCDFFDMPEPRTEMM